jgi:hypothetical protein
VKRVLAPARTVQEGDRLPSHPGRTVKRVDPGPGKAVRIHFDNGESHVHHMDERLVVERE